MHDFLYLVKALADGTRLRIVCALQRRGELCVCQLVQLLGLAQSTVSKHMAILHQARLVDSRKDGRWVYYSVPQSAVPERVRTALDWVRESLADDEQVCRDSERLSEILSVPVEELCRRGKST